MIFKRLANVFLVGPMGAGKSTIGKKLSDKLHFKFIDSDQEIEQRSGADIGWIFDVEGEEGFRVREEKIIDDVSSARGIILATGGGTIQSEKARNLLAARGTVIYLSADIDQQVDRTVDHRRRPLLRDVENPRETLLQLMEEREPLYRDVADFEVSTNGRSANAVANEILKLLAEHFS